MNPGDYTLHRDRLASTRDIVHQMANLLLQKRSQDQAHPITIGQR